MTIKETLQDKSAVVKEKVHDAIDQAKERLGDLQHKASEKVEHLQEDLHHGTESIVSDTQGLAHEVKEQMGATVKSVTGHVQEVVGRTLDKPALEAEGLSRQAEAEIQREHAND